MINKDTEVKLQILRTFLKEQDIPERRYSIGEYCDESICIEADNDGWVVYAGDRGNRYEEEVFSEFSDAACHLLSRVAYSHSEEESLAKSFKDYLEKCEADVSVNTTKTEPFFLVFFRGFVPAMNNVNYWPLSFYIHIVAILILMIITALATYRITEINTEQRIVNVLAQRIEIVRENDSLEEVIDKLSNAINDKNIQIAELTEEIANLEDKIAGQDVSDREKETLQKSLADKQQEVNELEKEKGILEDNLNTLFDRERDRYLEERIGSGPKEEYSNDLLSAEVIKNEGVTINTNSDSVLGDIEFSYYIGTDSDDEAYIEYNLDKEYSSIFGYIYIPEWVHEEYGNDNNRIGNATVSIDVTYDNTENYKEIYLVSGLSIDSVPVIIDVSITGATKLKITFREGGGSKGNDRDSIIRLGGLELRYDEDFSANVSTTEDSISE